MGILKNYGGAGRITQEEKRGNIFCFLNPKRKLLPASPHLLSALHYIFKIPKNTKNYLCVGFQKTFFKMHFRRYKNNL